VSCPVCDRPLVKGDPRGRFSVRCRSCRCYVEIHVHDRVDAQPHMR
jgi:hypothetical protein